MQVIAYQYEGNERERVPRNFQRLIVNPGIQVLPGWLCDEYLSLREVTLPQGFIKIGSRTFAHCKSLSEINICSTVESIGEGAFARCDNLTKVDF